MPIIEVVCKRTNISRATYYRWKKIDQKFSKTAHEAQSEGNSLIDDMAESQLISLIKDKSITAITYWLSHRHKAYAPKLFLEDNKTKQELSEEELKLLKKAIDLTPLVKYEADKIDTTKLHSKAFYDSIAKYNS